LAGEQKGKKVRFQEAQQEKDTKIYSDADLELDVRAIEWIYCPKN
jgi:hypothetical protein